MISSEENLLPVDDLRPMLTGMIERTRECEEELNALDAELGDGDLGSTLASVAEALERACDALPLEWGAALTQLGKVIGGVSGSSFTSLLMVGLSAAGDRVRGRTALSTEDRSAAWAAALAAMLEVSGARLGNKTMLDVVAAIVDASEDAKVVSVAAHTIDRYRPARCGAGRARIAAERSIGRDDPGMIAVLRFLEGATRPGASS